MTEASFTIAKFDEKYAIDVGWVSSSDATQIGLIMNVFVSSDPIQVPMLRFCAHFLTNIANVNAKCRLMAKKLASALIGANAMK
jgi:hypothetical protein